MDAVQLSNVEKDFRKLIRIEDRNFEEHLSFLSELQWSMIIFIVVVIGTLIDIQVRLARNYSNQKARQPRNDIVVKVDEHEEGEAQYLLSFFTRYDYKDATTAVTTIHLIGAAFPGRIHDISTAYKAKEVYQMFAPRCTEKVIVKEDVELEPITGLTIKTNQYGMHPTWRCKSIVIRNLNTNDAWFFKVNKEIGFGQTIRAVTPQSLLTLKFSFFRRMRREYRNGQHVFVGYWAWAPESVYSTVQRVVVAAVAHSCLICFCMVGLYVIFPLGYESTGVYHPLTEKEKQIKGYDGVKKYGWSLHGESHLTIWLYEIFLSAILSCMVTTFLGLLMVIHFRQQRVYERSLGEMDYVVATALQQISIAKREKAAIAGIRKKNVQNASKLNDFTSKKITKRDSDSSMYPPRDSIFEPYEQGLDELGALPLEILSLVSPAEARARQRIMFMGVNHQNDPRYTKFFNLPPIIIDSNLLENEDFLGNSLLAENYKRRYFPEALADEESTEMITTPPTSMTDENASRQTLTPHQHQRSNAVSQFYKEVYFRNRINYQKVNSGIPEMNPGFHVVVPQLILPSYRGHGKLSKNGNNISIELPGEQDFIKRSRPWYRPYSAWVITIVILVAAVAGIGSISVLIPETNINSSLYFLILFNTYVLAVTLSCLVFEPIKMVIIALFYAYDDRKLHEYISDKSTVPGNVGFHYEH